jgi:hypothetical protein
MADPVLEIDAAASNVDGSNPGTAMLLVDSTTGWGLISFDAPSPELKLLWTSSVDMDGSLRADPGNYENRTVTAQLAVERSTAALCQAQLRILGHKMGKLGREGGTLKVTYPSGNTFIFDVLAGSHNFTFDHAFVLGNLAMVNVSFTCLPGARGAEQDLGDNTETTLPALVFTEASIPGDLSALGRLVIDDDSATNQWWMTWGIQSRYYSSSANAALFYQAEGRTTLGAATTASSITGSSGSSYAVLTILPSGYVAMLSTQATGGGAHLSHVGTFRVYARVQAPSGNTGTVTMALEWGHGDFLNVARNAPTDLSGLDQWRYVDLGLVSPRAVVSGTQQWEGRIIVKATGDSNAIAVDYLLLVPVNEGSGIASGVLRSSAPSTFNAEDHFTTTTAGNALNARVAPSGGTWATSGDATDLAFDDDADPVTAVAGEHIKRSAVSGTSGRFAILGSTNYVNVQVESRINYVSLGSGQFLDQGVIARWTDSSNYLRTTFERSNSGGVITNSLRLSTVIAGSATLLASATFPAVASISNWWKLRLQVNSSGSVTASILADVNSAGLAVGTVMATCSGSSSALATGGTLATGKPGLWDRVTAAGTSVRYYDDFLVSTFLVDAAAFASQSIEVRYDRVQREDSGGTMWTPVSSYEGDYLKVPPSGAESRTLRALVKMSRNDPFQLDNAIDDISARLFVTPRYLQVPSA